MISTIDNDAEVNLAATQLFCWKPGKVLAVAVAVVTKAVDGQAMSFWPDSVDVSFVGDDDKATIGIAYRMLTKCGLIAKTGAFRKSKTQHGHGRTIFSYRLVSLSLAYTFLGRHGQTVQPQASQPDLL